MKFVNFMYGGTNLLTTNYNFASAPNDHDLLVRISHQVCALHICMAIGIGMLVAGV